MKKFISFILLIVLVGQAGLVGLASENGEDGGNGTGSGDNTIFIVTKVLPKKLDGKEGKITTGNEFELTIELEKTSGEIDNNNDVYVQINPSDSFSLKGIGSKVKAESISENEFTAVFETLHYNGGTNSQIPITISYKKEGKILSTNDYINIPNIEPYKEPEKPEPQPEIDPSQIVPHLAIIGSKTIAVDAGDTKYLPFTIKNTSNEIARNITVSAELEGGSPINIVGSGYDSISRIFDGSTKDVEFRVSVDGDADAKTYHVKINFHFYNERDYAFTTSDTVYVKVENKKTTPIVAVNKISTMPDKIEAGQPAAIILELENKGTLDAREIEVTLNGLSNDTFTLNYGTNTQYVQNLAGGKKTDVYFQIKPSHKIAGGSHSLELNLSYKDSAGREHERPSKFFVDVASNKDRQSSLTIEKLKYPQDALGQNQSLNIGFTLKNQGKIPAENIKITAESTDLTGVVPKTVSTKKIKLMKPGEAQDISFGFLTGPEAETRNYPINITVEYEDELLKNDKYTLSQYVGVFVVAPGEEDAKGKPKLIIDKYTFEPGLVRAGDNFIMNLSFFNTNGDKAVNNIKIFLTSDESSDPNSPSAGGSVFTPVNSSNTFYIDSIPPKGRIEKSIELSTIPDALAKTYTVTANFEYEDNTGEEYTATELIGIPVVQQSKLEVGELFTPPEAFQWEPTPVSVEFYNTGKVTLYNLMIRLEGDFQTENATYYVGNFESGSTDYFEGLIIPEEPGEVKGDIVFTYEDSTGETVEYREEFSFNVMEPMPMEDFDDMPPMEEEGRIKKLLKNKIFWALVIIGAGIGGFIFYKKRKEKGMALDE